MSDSEEDTLLEKIEETKEQLEKDPTNVQAHFTQGTTYFKLDEYETALKCLKKGLELAKKSSKTEEQGLVQKFEMWIRKCNTNLAPDDTSMQVDVKDAPSQPPPKPAAGDTPAPADPPARKTPVRHEWYQTPKEVVVTFFAKKRSKEHVKVTFEENSVEVVITLNENQEFQHNIDPLYKDIVPDKSTWIITPYKLECTLIKKEPGLQWKNLESVDGTADSTGVTMNQDDSARPEYPSSCRKKTNWSELNAAVKKEEEEEKPEGDAALTKLFQDIYGKADDDTKRAMQKSYVESGGTVLSTNWSEVGAKKVEATPPKGMEFASWDSRFGKEDAEDSHYEKPDADKSDDWR
eukprot:NODE_143_length_1359_cov_437.837662_g139_i0.p1 GENE.NODE_143_length_1359_cov_437.837662_g139_i0~~NODE_143_length_1359_cov_437.837662_g139_i0.p1  ORF type:complete len:349 (+),score=107.82 NODE_143_length_1359_cov_437.837662_g139_i0:69-1115(+)